jgi:hypothetical protein
VTSTADTAGHPDVAEISELTEGLLPLDRSTDVRRHLDACETCADIHASLEEIRGMLGSLPAPEPMPVDVAQRIDAALAAEALLSSSDGRSTSHVSRETSAPADRPAGRPQATTGPGRMKKGRTHRRRAVVLGSVLTAAVLGAGALVLHSLDSGTSTTTAHGKPSASAGPFSGASVQNQVRDLLASPKATQRGSTSQRPRSGIDSGQGTAGATASANTLLQPEVAVPDCVRQAIPRGEQALAAKTGTYGGKNAYLVVLPDPGNSARVTAYVVDAACVGQQPVTAGTILLKQSFARS